MMGNMVVYFSTYPDGSVHLRPFIYSFRRLENL